MSVAPMMDWTDRAKAAFPLNGLHGRQGPCLLYVSSPCAAPAPAFGRTPVCPRQWRRVG